MIHDLEDKLFRGEAERDRREARMGAYGGKIRARFTIVPAIPWRDNDVQLAAQPRCDVFRVDTSRAEPE